MRLKFKIFDTRSIYKSFSQTSFLLFNKYFDRIGSLKPYTFECQYTIKYLTVLRYLGDLLLVGLGVKNKDYQVVGRDLDVLQFENI